MGVDGHGQFVVVGPPEEFGFAQIGLLILLWQRQHQRGLWAPIGEADHPFSHLDGLIFPDHRSSTWVTLRMAASTGGHTGHQILQVILRGEDDPAVLPNLALRWVPSKRDALERALHGRVSDHHRGLLRELLELIQHQD